MTTHAKATAVIDAATIVTRASSPRVYSALVSPETAADWVGKNSHNRPIRNAQVAKLVGVIQRGEWILNGDAIRFDVNDTLADGQHRLWAIIDSGIAVPTFVIVGLEPEAQETLGFDVRRSFKDVLVLREESNALHLAAAVSYLWKQENGYLRTAMTPTVQQGLVVLEEHPGIREAVRDAASLRRRFRLSQSMLAVVRYTFDSIDSEAASVFFTKLYEGQSLDAGDPILVLRQYLESQAALGVGARSGAIHHHAIIIKAWNAWREGRKIERLNWKSGGLKAEPFPEPHG